MKATKQWAFALTIDGIYAALFYLWQFKGMDGAGNILLTVLWIITVAGFLIAPVMLVAPSENIGRSPTLYAFSWLFTVTTFAALAWVGHYVLASLYLVCAVWIYLCRGIALERAKKAAAGTTGKAAA